jgi:alkaline phosphatase
MKPRIILPILIIATVLVGWRPAPNPPPIGCHPPQICPPAKYLVLMIGDGMGDNQRRSADLYTGSNPAYESWPKYWVSTYPAGGSYNHHLAWTSFSYVLSGWTDSAAAATALYTGVKTENIRISVSEDGLTRLVSIADKARQGGKAVGAVTSVYISHATPGAWLAHNNNRNNGFAIADESLWGDPNTTGTAITSTYYSGGHGATLPPAEVVIGAGYPASSGDNYMNTAIRNKLAAESGLSGAFTFVERLAGSPNGGARLLSAANNPTVARLAGLFGRSGGYLDYRLANGSGANLENPTLAEMTQAALLVLSRDQDGFVLMVEGGAIDKAAHANNMDQMVGEVLDFNDAIQTVIDWVDDPGTESTWANTLVIVTADHETGYLTQAPGVFPDQPLGAIFTDTLALEKTVLGTGLRASWQDSNLDSLIDPGEMVYWAWNTTGHSNSLVPLFAKGAGAELIPDFTDALDPDPKRGAYLDNTELFCVMENAIFSPCPANFQLFLPVTLNKD